MNTLTTQQIHAFIGPVVVMAERDHQDALFTAIANGQALLARFYAIELVRIERALHLIYHSHNEEFSGDDLRPLRQTAPLFEFRPSKLLGDRQ